MGDDVILKHDCRYYRGSRPCLPNKLQGTECAICQEYSPVGTKILIIKLDSIGDVVRTLSLFPALLKLHANPYVVWITCKEAVEIVNACPYVDEVWEYNTDALVLLQSHQWNWLYNLGNDHLSAGLTSLASVTEGRVGFIMGERWIEPTNEAAKKWLEIASFDRLKKLNKNSYQKIIYDIVGITEPIARPEIILPKEGRQRAKDLLRKLFPKPQNGTLIGISTGAGNRWPKKTPDLKRWVQIIHEILANSPVASIALLGGPEERLKNAEIEKKLNNRRVRNTGCEHSLLQFAAIIEQVDVLICGDTLALHIASAMNIPSVALFGPTSSTEIYDYNGLIEKVATDDLDCLCCYSDCTREDNCMTLIPVKNIIEKIKIKLTINFENMR